ncbi:SDR family oxidoreductase [Oribacterium sp. HCP28S3_H8]|uniref:SDR family oxidoreductase n=1 Tax=Oribacterium sp. HCP28S3_H8 TaxID=3438945 RepID=UPI003F8C64CA
MRIWLITGAGSGLGKEIARAAILDGDQVAVTSRNTDKLKELADLAPDRVLSVALEVTDTDSREMAVQKTVGKFGGLNILVNNAGRGFHTPVEDTTPEDMRLVFETNYFGAVEMIQHALPYLRKAGDGVIVNLSSMGVHSDNSVGNAFYISSKAALDATSKVLRNELKPFHVQVMVVEPGAFRTNFRIDSVAPKGKRSDIYKDSYASGDYLKTHAFNQPGDPVKAGKLIEQAAVQEEVPEILVLGKGMTNVEIDSLRNRIEKVKACRDIAEQADYDDATMNR